MLGKFFVGQRVSQLDMEAPFAPVSRVTLVVDGDNSYTAGDDTGREIKKTMPWATQAMAESVLRSLRDVTYRPFSGVDALLDPASEIGDGITVGGMYSVLAKADITFDALYTADIAAPGGDEVEDEYPYKSKAARQEERKFAQTNSRITKTANQILLEVKNEVGGLSSSIDVQLESITNRVENNENGLSQTLRIAADGVTITNAQGSTLTIDGGQIDASKIKTEQLDASKIHAEDLNLTGNITWSDLANDAKGQVTSAQNAASAAQSAANSAQSTASSALSAANSAQTTVSGWSYLGTTYIDGSKLMTGTVKATSLQGGSVSLLDAYGSSCGVITLTPAASSSYAVDISSYSAMRMAANSGDLYMSAYNYYYLWISSSGVSVNAPFFSRNVSSLGTSGYPWSDVYANNAVIQTSDLNVKKDVRYGLDDYDALFDALRPMSFLFTNGESGRRHLGLGAQDVEAAMDKLGVSSMDFAGFIKSKREEGSAYNYALRYGEFIPLCIEQIQKLKARVAELEGRTS